MIKIKNNKKKLNRFRNNKNFKTTIISLSSLGAITIILGSTIPFCIGVQYKSAIQVVVSDPSSQLADNSFSENVYEGVRNFFKKESGINLPSAKDCSEGNGLWKRPGTTGHDWERMNTYENIKNDGSKVIIATGFNQQSALQKVTSTTYSNYFNSLKDTGFIFVDGRLEKEYNDGVNKVNSDPTNISSITDRKSVV